ncbi:hypothetical protein, partial [Mycoplasma elephantis]|uniref:hypothetical protein n=1 Tax=Mycoplasma elephantis TaxID=114882 RepID=UPI00055CCF05
MLLKLNNSYQTKSATKLPKDVNYLSINDLTSDTNINFATLLPNVNVAFDPEQVKPIIDDDLSGAKKCYLKFSYKGVDVKKQININGFNNLVSITEKEL